jgi:hypothetical protein
MDTLLEKLQQQLAQYGLDPKEWTIEPIADSFFKAIGSDLELMGQVCPIDGWIYLTIKKT